MTHNEKLKARKRDEVDQRLLDGLAVVDVGAGCGVLSLCLWKRQTHVERVIATDYSTPLTIALALLSRRTKLVSLAFVVALLFVVLLVRPSGSVRV